jgi:hypothetical protein
MKAVCVGARTENLLKKEGKLDERKGRKFSQKLKYKEKQEKELRKV